MKKNESIQILRAIAALLVVHLHSVFMVSQRGTPRYSQLFHVTGFGACGVDIFFAISGFILSSVALNVRRHKVEAIPNGLDFLLRRFIRIFPIYWLLSGFYLLVAIKQHHFDPSVAIDSYLLLPSLHFPMPAPLIFVGWTLIFEMFFYYLITLNLLFGSQLAVERTMLSIAALVICGVLVGIHHPVLILVCNPINLEFALGCLIGVTFYKYGKQQKVGTILLVIGTVLLLSTLFAGNPEISDNKKTLDGALSWYRLLVWGAPSAMITAGLAFRTTPIRSKFGRFGVFLGDASYSIYLIALIVFFGYDRLYPHLPHLNPSTNVAISFAAVIIAGSLCYRYVESPMTRFLTAKYHGSAIQSAP